MPTVFQFKVSGVLMKQFKIMLFFAQGLDVAAHGNHTLNDLIDQRTLLDEAHEISGWTGVAAIILVICTTGILLALVLSGHIKQRWQNE